MFANNTVAQSYDEPLPWTLTPTIMVVTDLKEQDRFKTDYQGSLHVDALKQSAYCLHLSSPPSDRQKHTRELEAGSLG